MRTGIAVCRAAVVLPGVGQRFAVGQVHTAVRAGHHGLGAGRGYRWARWRWGHGSAALAAPQRIGQPQHDQHQEKFHRPRPSNTSNTKRVPA